MKKDLKSIRLIRFLLIAISSVVFLIGIYQHRSAFMKGWNETPAIDGPHSGFHAAIFKNVISKEGDSLQISGQGSYRFKLEKEYLVTGDVFSKEQGSSQVFLYKVCAFVLMTTILILTVLILLNLFRFLGDSSRGEIFTLVNIDRIKAIGLYCVSMSLLLLVVDLINFLIQLEFFRFTEYQVNYAFDLDYTLFAVGMVTMVIMYVFKKGHQLKEEQELTV
ncbi:Protein of unknown function [Pedobacter steynii]|uniref:DUF2975 domain-containing protein n=1 Tax=Pedobacter steynii TaxID=430522 RepID=A0A1G9MTZ5_9SPHI|nr:DUF2975 domain-containing protein [Pedobacter steynii]NQX39497.1 DUF2975 domain-containing protein [Pedobacter steynii]SDL77710.1 Protein of unknown function [Pedobacter steynii]